MKVRIVSPETTLYDGQADSVKLPGEAGRFEVLQGHAPIISTLTQGTVSVQGTERYSVEVSGGFVEVARDTVNVCIETI